MADLREYFYRHYFESYCDFVRKSHLSRFYNVNTSKYETPDNAYVKAVDFFNKHQEDSKKIHLTNLDANARNFTETELVNAIDCFFQLIADNPKAQTHVEKLLNYMSYGGTWEMFRDCEIENDIAKLILQYFWEKKQNKLKLKKKDVSEIEVNYEAFANPKNDQERDYANYDNVVYLIGSLLGGRGNNNKYYTVKELLDCVRLLRNGFTHPQKETFCDYADASALLRFKLYTFITTVLYLRKSLNITDDFHIVLHVQCTKELKTQGIHVELKEDNRREVKKENEEGGWKFNIFRYHNYCLTIGSTKENFTPEWNWISPLGEYDGEKITCKSNEFEASSALRNATFNSVLQANKDIKKLLKDIHESNNRNAEATLEQSAQNTNAIVEQLKLLVQKLDNQKENKPEVWITVFQKIEEQLEKNIRDEGEKTRKEVDEKSKEIQDKVQEGTGEVKGTVREEGNERKAENKRNWKLLCGLVVLGVLILAGVGYLIWRQSATSERLLSPKELLAQGDLYAHFGEFEKAGDCYRQAIKCYEDTLSKDSNNVNANIGLAMMLMRGKGDFDLVRAERCARRAASDTTQSRGEGLYVYLLTRNNRCDEAKKWLQQKMYQACDTYAQLAENLLIVLGKMGQQSPETIKEAFQNIREMKNQEAMFEYANLAMDGIKDECDHYVITPRPILGAGLMKGLADDSISPIGMAIVSDVHALLNEPQPSMDYTYRSLACGCNIAAPVLRFRMLNYIDLAASDEKIRTIYDKISKLTTQQNSLVANVTDYMQEEQKYRQGKGGLTLTQLLTDLDTLIVRVEKDNTEELGSTAENIFRHRVTLCLENGDLGRATSLAMQLDDCSDSLAVCYYLQGICHAKGYGSYAKSLEKSDSLINLAAERGYVEAIYTRLRRHDDERKWLVEEHEVQEDNKTGYSSSQKPAVLDYVPSNESTVKNANTKIDNEQTDFDDIDMSIQLGVSSSFSFKTIKRKYSLVIYPYADVAEHFYQESPRLAMALDDYWFPYYNANHQLSPYLKYCPTEFQVNNQVVAKAFDYNFDGENQSYTWKQLSMQEKQEIIELLESGIASALNNWNGQMARHLVSLRVMLSYAYHIDIQAMPSYEYFMSEDYKNGQLKLFKRIESPVYAY